MTAGIKASSDGLSASIQVGGFDKVVIGATGIAAGSYAPASITPTELSQKPTLGTAVNTTSGTAIDFTSIPSWAKKIAIALNGVSTNGTSNVILQLGAGSIDAASYSGASQQGGSPQAYSTGFLVSTSALAASVRHGSLTLTHMGSNVWAFNGNIADTNSTWCVSGAGVKALSGTLDRVRLTTVGGTDTFDAGSVNILFE